MQLLEQAPWLQDRLMFATDYPHWDFDAPDQALPKIELPDGFAAKLMAENARQLYKLPVRVCRSGLSAPLTRFRPVDGRSSTWPGAVSACSTSTASFSRC